MVLIKLLINAAAVYLTSLLLSEGVTIDNFLTAVVVALVLGIINILIKPILTILTLPITCLTLGLFSLVVNALMIMLADYIVPGFSVATFIWALLFSLVLSLVSSLLNKLIK